LGERCRAASRQTARQALAADAPGVIAAATTISSADNRAGSQLARSSSRAAAKPKAA
jgi:hypothetical protein